MRSSALCKSPWGGKQAHGDHFFHLIGWGQAQFASSLRPAILSLSTAVPSSAVKPPSKAYKLSAPLDSAFPQVSSTCSQHPGCLSYSCHSLKLEVAMEYKDLPKAGAFSSSPFGFLHKLSPDTADFEMCISVVSCLHHTSCSVFPVSAGGFVL